MQVVDGEMLLTLDTGQSEDGFYTLLNGYDFSDFDLRVQVRQPRLFRVGRSGYFLRAPQPLATAFDNLTILETDDE
ncbi:MAG: hypothetical protein F9K27_05470 [Anaerolineae bacterium]|nr:MAG: hypothetical protein F9K27_05470 [Anaerolineae bacterium]